MSTTRTTLGKNFNEGARLLWLALAERDWTASDLREEMTGPSGNALGVGVVDRFLYGDGLPSVGSAAQIEALLGVPSSAWSRPARYKFTLPAAKRHAAKVTASLSSRKPNARHRSPRSAAAARSSGAAR